MKTFLIILAVIVLIFAIILSLSAEATVVYDNGWHTTVQVLFIKKDVELSKILNFVLFPDKAGKEAAEKQKEKKKNRTDSAKPVIQENKEEIKQVTEPNNDIKETNINSEVTAEPEKTKAEPNQQPKKNPIAKIIDEDGIVGIML